MNASTNVRLKIMKGQRNFPLLDVVGLMAENEALRKTNATLREAKTARLDYIGGHVIQAEDGSSLYCEPVPVVMIGNRKEQR